MYLGDRESNFQLLEKKKKKNPQREKRKWENAHSFLKSRTRTMDPKDTTFS